MSKSSVLVELQEQEGQETHLGGWKTVTQDMIDVFADVTGDRQWIHTDPNKAGLLSPFGATVAHGFLTLSLIPALASNDDVGSSIPGLKLAVNYGLNRVRFPNAVVSGSRVRARSTLIRVEEVGDNALQVVRQVLVEIEGQSKPGCVAETVTRLYF